MTAYEWTLANKSRLPSARLIHLGSDTYRNLGYQSAPVPGYRIQRVSGPGCFNPESPFCVDSDNRVFREGTVDDV